MIQFGAGILYLAPTAGNLATNPTPGKALTLQTVSLDISQDLKELRGSSKFPEDIAPADMKLNGKFGIGRDDYELYNQIFFADVQTPGTKQIVSDEVATVPSADPYSFAVSNSTNFLQDFGLRYASGAGGPYGNGKLQKVFTAPVAGQYNVSQGIYTLSAADAGAGILVSYVYASVAQGTTWQINNQQMGYGPVFEIWLSEPYQNINGLTGGIHLYAARASKISRELKRDGYLMPSIEYQAFANPAGQVAEAWNAGL